MPSEALSFVNTVEISFGVVRPCLYGIFLALCIPVMLCFVSSRRHHLARWTFAWILLSSLCCFGKDLKKYPLNAPIGLSPCIFAEAMPLQPSGNEDRKRAARRLGVEIHADRVVKPRTRTYRQTLLGHFDEWLVESMRVTLQELLEGRQFDAEFISEALTAYGKDLYYAGRPYGQYSETINAVTALKPALRKQVQLAWDLAFNWAADEPHEHHPALPLAVLLSSAALAILWGWDRVGAILLLTWSGLLRIGEVLIASRAELVLPRDSAPGAVTAFFKILLPKTRGRVAKHQCAKIDYPDVIQFLDAVYGKRPPTEKLWLLSPQTLRNRFNQLQRALGFQDTRAGGRLPYDLGSLRPGGATFLLNLTGRRTGSQAW